MKPGSLSLTAGCKQPMTTTSEHAGGSGILYIAWGLGTTLRVGQKTQMITNVCMSCGLEEQQVGGGGGGGLGRRIRKGGKDCEILKRH